MVTSRKILTGAIGHIVLLIINFLVFVGLVESYQILAIELPPFTVLVLGYMVIHTTVLLSVQLGIQVLELIRIKMPTLLISYYFLFDDDEAIPLPLLDPVKSRLGVITLLLVISGGPIFYPIFAASGLLFVLAIIAQKILNMAFKSPGLKITLSDRIIAHIIQIVEFTSRIQTTIHYH